MILVHLLWICQVFVLKSLQVHIRVCNEKFRIYTFNISLINIALICFRTDWSAHCFWIGITLYKRGFNGYTISMQLLTKTVDT